MLTENAGEFLDISRQILIELRAEDDQNLPSQQVAVKRSVGVGDAVGGDQQIGIVEVGGFPEKSKTSEQRLGGVDR